MGQVKRWNSGEQLTDQKKDRIFSVTVEAQKNSHLDKKFYACINLPCIDLGHKDPLCLFKCNLENGLVQEPIIPCYFKLLPDVTGYSV